MSSPVLNRWQSIAPVREIASCIIEPVAINNKADATGPRLSPNQQMMFSLLQAAGAAGPRGSEIKRSRSAVRRPMECLLN